MPCARVLAVTVAVAVALGGAVCAGAESEPLGCGGFVRLSDAFRARGTADLSTVRVRLMRGSVAKFATECSPAGYFFLPAYEPGDYTVVVDTSTGFVFDTAAQAVTLAPGAAAAAGSALVFTVTGITVTGTFAAPVAAPVALLDAATGAAVATATADGATGAFAFAGVLPGAYVAAVAHAGWTFAARTQRVDALGRVPATLPLPAPFVVTGYDVRGAVAADAKGRAAPELILALYRDAGNEDNSESEEKKENKENKGDSNDGENGAVPRCGAGALGRAEIAGIAETEAAQGLEAAAFVCAVRSRADASGAFVLENVAPGAYVLVPHRADAAGTAYDVAPARVAVAVAADAVALRERFRVVGLRVAGTVATAAGRPLAGVEITAHARGTCAPVAAAVSDAAGRYRLPGVRAGAVLEVAARAADGAFVFAPLRDVAVAPGAPAVLPPLHPLGTRVSGRVVLHAGAGKNKNRNALTYPCTLAVLDAATGAPVSTITTGRTGDFSTYLPDGTYTLRVVRADRAGDSSTATAAAPIPGAPAPLRVTVASAPVDGLVLEQEAYPYRGTVRFLQACPAGLRVYLAPRGRAGSDGSADAEVRTAPVVPEGGRADATVGTFVFEDVLAGDYELSVVPPAVLRAAPGSATAAARGALCFAQESHNVTVARAAAPPTVVFAQMGYRLTLAAPVAVEDVALTCAADPGLLLHQPLRAGVPLALCVSTPGRWHAAPHDTLTRFDRAHYDVYAAPEPSPVATATLTPAAFRVRGTVQLAATVPAALLPRVRVLATVANVTKNSRNRKTAGAEKALAVDTEIAEDDERTLYYAAWLRVGERAVFSFAGPDGLVFYPPQRTATMRAASDAATRLALVAARPEVVLRGRIDPPTEHVQVTVTTVATTSGDDNDSTAAAGAETVVATAETDAEGRYAVHGLRDDAVYRERFVRAGLAFEVARPRAQAGDELVVAAVRRAALTVVVRDAADGAPLAGVLVAVSGGTPDAPFHTHALTAADGTLTTGELAPGDYYARPLLKEYAFAPAGAAVAVARGAAPTVAFAGTRRAYSVFGRVTRLDQHAAAGVSVVAVPENNGVAAEGTAAVTEQAQTDETGAYRIRGLVPGVRYTVRLDSETAPAANSTEDNSTASNASSPRGHSFPAERTVAMGTADVRGQDFVAVPLARGAVSQVLGRVAARDAGALAHMEAVLSCNGSALQVVPLARLPVFGFAGLRAGTYDVALRQTVVPSKKQPASTVRCTAQPAHAAVTVAHAALAEVRFTVACAEDASATATTAAAAGARAHRTTSVWSLVAIAAALAAFAQRERVAAVAGDAVARVQQWIAVRRGGKPQQARRSGRRPLQQSRGALAKPMTAEDRAASFLPEHLQKKK